MSNIKDLKELSGQHLRTAEILMSAGDWPGAAYMLGYVLEFMLKACACKTLNLISYPESHKSDKVAWFFKTHSIDQLAMISGTTDLFERGSVKARQNWSDFTAQYLGEWPGMRYDKEKRKQFTEKSVKKLHGCLVSNDESILKVVDKHKRC